jgi:6-hydroxycyclohex-1-ene-1-carbonyl-CoA dehydrogenase
VRDAVRAGAKKEGFTPERWKVFECSGTTAGQETAWDLLTPAGVVSVVGYTSEKASLRLSNLMAFHARAVGTWGCAPERYPAALDLVLSRKVHLRPYLQTFDLDALPEVIERVRNGTLRRRPVLVPRKETA